MTMSHVCIGHHSCVVCGIVFESGEVLLDKRLKPVFDSSKKNITRFGLCEECRKTADTNGEDNYIALVECDGAKSLNNKGLTPGTTMSPADVYRTGRILWVLREALTRGMQRELPAQPAMYVEMGVIDMLQGERAPHKTVQ